MVYINENGRTINHLISLRSDAPSHLLYKSNPFHPTSYGTDSIHQQSTRHLPFLISTINGKKKTIGTNMSKTSKENLKSRCVCVFEIRSPFHINLPDPRPTQIIFFQASLSIMQIFFINFEEENHSTCYQDQEKR